METPLGTDPYYLLSSEGWQGFTDDPARLGKTQYYTQNPPPGFWTQVEYPGFVVGADRVTSPNTGLDGLWCFYAPDRKFYQARWTGKYAIPSGHRIYTIHSYTNGQCRAYVASTGITLTVWERIRYEGHFDSISDIANALGNVAINEQPRRLVILTTADGVRPDNGEPYAPGIYEVRYSQAGTSSIVNRVLFWTDHPPGATGDGSGGVTLAQVDAKIQAHSAVASAHHTLAPTEGQPGGGSVVDVIDGRLPGAAVAMRIAWSQSRVFEAGSFTRANDHPIDGASVGLTSGVETPPFPPSLATDATLYLGVWIAGDPVVLSVDVEGFPSDDRVALAVDGVDGFYYPALNRVHPFTETLSVVLGGGPLLATDEAIDEKIATHAGISTAHHTPPDVGEHIDQEARDSAAAAAAVAMTAQTAADAAQTTADDAGGSAVDWTLIPQAEITAPTSWTKVANNIIPATGALLLSWLGGGDVYHSVTVPCAILRGSTAQEEGSGASEVIGVGGSVALARTAENELLFGFFGSGEAVFIWKGLFSV